MVLNVFNSYRVGIDVNTNINTMKMIWCVKFTFIHFLGFDTILIIGFISLLLMFWNDSNNDIEIFDIFNDILDKLDFFSENKFFIFWVAIPRLSSKRIQ